MKKVTICTVFLLLIWSSRLIAAEAQYKFTTIAVPQAKQIRSPSALTTSVISLEHIRGNNIWQGETNHIFIYSSMANNHEFGSGRGLTFIVALWHQPGRHHFGHLGVT